MDSQRNNSDTIFVIVVTIIFVVLLARVLGINCHARILIAFGLFMDIGNHRDVNLFPQDGQVNHEDDIGEQIAIMEHGGNLEGQANHDAMVGQAVLLVPDVDANYNPLLDLEVVGVIPVIDASSDGDEEEEPSSESEPEDNDDPDDSDFNPNNPSPEFGPLGMGGIVMP